MIKSKRPVRTFGSIPVNTLVTNYWYHSQHRDICKWIFGGIGRLHCDRSKYIVKQSLLKFPTRHKVKSAFLHFTFIEILTHSTQNGQNSEWPKLYGVLTLWSFGRSECNRLMATQPLKHPKSRQNECLIFFTINVSSQLHHTKNSRNNKIYSVDPGEMTQYELPHLDLCRL